VNIRTTLFDLFTVLNEEARVGEEELANAKKKSVEHAALDTLSIYQKGVYSLQ